MLDDFVSHTRALGYKVKVRKSVRNGYGKKVKGATSADKQTVYINRRTFDQQTLIDEYTHVYNNVRGRGNFLDAQEAIKHNFLGGRALKGGTGGLNQAENALFHQFELKNFLKSGQQKPSFFNGINESAFDEFLFHRF